MGNKTTKLSNTKKEIVSIVPTVPSKPIRKTNTVKTRYFGCVHRTSGVETYYDCCELWVGCGTCHKMVGCDKKRTRNMKRIRCLTCLYETSSVGDGTCPSCRALWGLNPCKECNNAIMEGYSFRHCNKCRICVRSDFKHCDKCNSCFCGNSEKDKCYWSKECSICYEKIKGRRLIIMGRIVLSECGHNFHWTCFRDWMDTGNHCCPMCRSSFNLQKSNKRIPDKYQPPLITTDERTVIVEDYDFCENT